MFNQYLLKKGLYADIMIYIFSISFSNFFNSIIDNIIYPFVQIHLLKNKFKNKKVEIIKYVTDLEKNINFDIPDSKYYFLIEKKISNYKINFDIKSKKIIMS